MVTSFFGRETRLDLVLILCPLTEHTVPLDSSNGSHFFLPSGIRKHGLEYYSATIVTILAREFCLYKSAQKRTNLLNVDHCAWTLGLVHKERRNVANKLQLWQVLVHAELLPS